MTPIVGSLAPALIESRSALAFSIPEETVGGLTRVVASLNAMTLSDQVDRTADHDPELWRRLRNVVSQSLSIPEEAIRPHSRFVEDLRVG